MLLPSLLQYIQTVSNPSGLTKSLGQFTVERDCYRQVAFCAGRNAGVFKIWDESGNPRLLKCFLKYPRFASQKYALRDELLAPIQYLEEELYVFDHEGNGAYYDVAAGEWAEGETLENALCRAATSGDTATLNRLAESFDALASALLSKEWAHGDLKPENIIVGEEGKMKLIDYDALYLPELAGNPTTEIGTTPYQHPLRGAEMYDKHIDDYSIALISVSLHILARQPELYGLYNRGDNIILSPAEILAANSPLYNLLLEIWQQSGQQRLYRLTELLSNPTPRLDNLRELLSPTPQKNHPGPLLLFEQRGKWGYRNAAGEEIIPAGYDAAFDFSDSLAAVRLGHTWHFISPGNTIAINCACYGQVSSFSEGLAAVEQGSLWGYINMYGGQTIAPQFEMACRFSEGMAAVKTGGKYGYIDPRGHWVIPPLFGMAHNFRDGMAIVEIRGKRCIINKNGQTVESHQKNL